MKSRILILCVVLVGMCASTALALDPMGPPASGLNQGQFSLGVEYSYSEQNFWTVTDDYDKSFSGLETKMNKAYARLGYGISDKTEGFVRLGVADYDYARAGYYAPWKGDDDSAFAMGVGLKTTFSEDENIKWGGLIQVSWAEFSGKRTNSSTDSNYQTGSFETEIFELQLAAGPTYKLMESVSVYGGPFMHIIDGEHHHKHGGGSRKYDLEDRSSFGAYIGAQVDLAANTALNIEYQDTGDAWALAGGVTYKF